MTEKKKRQPAAKDKNDMKDRDDAAERLLWECREKFGMPDYLATSRTNWPESPCIH